MTVEPNVVKAATMDMRYLPDRGSFSRMTTKELRNAFVLDRLFVPGDVSMVYCDADRAIVGGAVPTGSPLTLEASGKEMAASYFTERREMGILNIGGAGTVKADNGEHRLRPKDMVYVGRGVRRIELLSEHTDRPAVFYFVSFPAHAAYPTVCVPFERSDSTRLGTAAGANQRTIHRYIHPGGAKSCQLVMGLTDLEPGSVWNTMPPHTHQRRSEVYLYFGVAADALVVHLMGSPGETRSVILRDREGVISPAWSIHSGAGTASYSFVWAMGGENQEFADMDAVAMKALY